MNDFSRKENDDCRRPRYTYDTLINIFIRFSFALGDFGFHRSETGITYNSLYSFATVTRKPTDNSSDLRLIIYTRDVGRERRRFSIVHRRAVVVSNRRRTTNKRGISRRPFTDVIYNMHSRTVNYVHTVAATAPLDYYSPFLRRPSPKEEELSLPCVFPTDLTHAVCCVLLHLPFQPPPLFIVDPIKQL